MTAALWARRYGDDLLTQLEREAEDGWPPSPTPATLFTPASSSASPERIRILERVIMHLYDLLLADERRLTAVRVEVARQTWRNTGQPHRTAA